MSTWKPKTLGFLAVATVVLASGPASALGVGADPIPPGFEAVFNGALVSTYDDGRQAKTWLSADGDFAAQGRNGGRNAGKWNLSKGRVCMRQTRPIPLPFHYCTPLPDSLKTAWRAKAPTGDAVTVRFVVGDRP